MPDSPRNLIEFETHMDETLHLEIVLLSHHIAQVSPNHIRHTLKKTDNPQTWRLEFTWRDAASMENHFSSGSLQTLLNLLISRCSRLSFTEFQIPPPDTQQPRLSPPHSR